MKVKKTTTKKKDMENKISFFKKINKKVKKVEMAKIVFFCNRIF